jgi:putative acetyltransferase
VKHRDPSATATSTLAFRPARFEEVPRLLQLVEGAIEEGCRAHYDDVQRRAVFLGYATNLFVDSVGPFETVVAEREGRLVGLAQLDPTNGGLRALFVAAGLQHQGVGRALLAAVETRARAAGCTRLGGAMSLNAAPFYAGAGFREVAGPERLLTVGVRVPVVRMEKRLGDPR